MIKIVCQMYFLLLFSHSCLCQETLKSKIEGILSDKDIAGAQMGISVRDLSSNEELCGINQDHFFIPASSLKILTTFGALMELGANYTFKTQIYYKGKLQEGILDGDLIINGGGDPSLGSSRKGLKWENDNFFNYLINVIEQAGIFCINGSIIIQETHYQDNPVYSGWPWNDVGNYYGAGIHSLNFRENEYNIYLGNRNKINNLAAVDSVSPAIPKLIIKSEVEVKKKGSGDNAYIYGGFQQYHKIIRGTIPQGEGSFRIRGSMPYPAEVIGSEILKKMEQNGIHVKDYKVVNSPLNNTHKVATIKSDPLLTLLSIANEESLNLYCEAFLKELSIHKNRKSGISTLNKRFAQMKLDTLDIYQVDGSGLSSRNLVKPTFFTSFLHAFHKSYGFDIVKVLLPRASIKGTVKNLLKNRASEGQAFLKSGYINHVLTYNGYVISRNGKKVAISLMANTFRCSTSKVRKIMEDIIDAIYLSV